jgi:hypothetical protein
MTSKQIRGMKLDKGDNAVILLREIAAGVVEFNERAKEIEPITKEIINLTFEQLKKVASEIDKDLQL